MVNAICQKMIFVSVLLAFVACASGLPGRVPSQRIRVSPMPSANRLFHFYTLPVGQGNAQVIQCPSGEISIFDMGSCSGDAAGFWIAQDIRDFLQGKFHLVKNIFITHDDKDHNNLLGRVFTSPADLTGLQSIYISSLLGDWDISIRNWVNNIRATNKVKTFNNGNTCGSSSPSNRPTPCENVILCPRDSGITARVLSVNAGQQCSPRSNNTDSIVLEITNGSFKLQLNGDFEDCTTSPTENNSPQRRMAEAYYGNVDLTVYMLAHHGADSKANKEVIRNAVAPMAVVASSDPWYNTRFRHPRCAIIDAFANDTKSLCKPGVTDTLNRFYCGQHPTANLQLEDKLQRDYTCGDSSGSIWTEDNNNYAIYSTRPNSTHINLVELRTNGNQWGFVNRISPMIQRQRARGSRATDVDECVDDD